MDSITGFMQAHPLIAVFLTVGCGFWLGRKRLGSFALGPVAATLVVGVLVGQMKIVIPDIFKTAFFLFFLFAIGYSVGPQFFASFRGNGLRQALFAVVMAAVCSGVVVAASLLMGYNTGVAAGLFAGSQTASACLGLLADTVRELPLDEERRSYLLVIIPACYAVTYLFGTVGSAWYLSVIGPRFMGGLTKVKADTAAIEQQMDAGTGLAAVKLSPGQIRAGRPVGFRAFRAETALFDSPLSASELESRLLAQGLRVMVERVRHADVTIEPQADTVIERGDVVVLGGRAEAIVGVEGKVGTEVADASLLNFAAERTPVTVSARGAASMTLGALRDAEWMDGVMISSLQRGGRSLPVRAATQLSEGDVITLVGFPSAVARAAAKIGYADAPSDVTDMVFVGLGIALGCLIGSLALKVKGVPLTLGLSGGTLIAGLFLGWLRNRRPSFGAIPSAALWVFNNLGLTMFIACIGITAGASFLHGLREAGWTIVLIGAVCTLLTLTIGIFLARKVFKFTSPETLGCVAGSRCAVAAIGAVVDTLGSDVPNLGYTVTYAVANIFLVLSSLLVLFIV